MATLSDLPTNAYGQGDLKEFGVHLPYAALNIGTVNPIDSRRTRDIGGNQQAETGGTGGARAI